MPIYEYECLSCGTHFDEMQKLSDPPVTECKLCKGKVRKLMGTPALQFKGTGWYVTDYAGKTPPPNSPGKEPAKPAETKSETSCACPSAGTCGQTPK